MKKKYLRLKNKKVLQTECFIAGRVIVFARFSYLKKFRLIKTSEKIDVGKEDADEGDGDGEGEAGGCDELPEEPQDVCTNLSPEHPYG